MTNSTNRLRGLHQVKYIKKENGLMYPIDEGIIQMADQTTNSVPVVVPPESPTGLPVIPPKLVPWLFVLAIVAAAIAVLPELGVALPAVVVTVAKVVSSILALFGIASPGLRIKSKTQ